MSRQSTWQNIGTELVTRDYRELLRASDLDYKTVAEDLFIEHAGQKIQVPNKKVLLRDDTKDIFGIVSDRYQICQNEDALDFVEHIDGVELQRAGQMGGTVWMIGKLPEVSVLGDSFSPHLIFQNSHDGSCSIKTTICMLRIVCQNQFVSAFKDSPATISVRHNGDLDEKLLIAKKTMSGVYDYIRNYDEVATELATKKITPRQLDKIVEGYFEIPEEASNRTVSYIMDRRDQFYNAYNADDNQNFVGTRWGVINAFSDFATHEDYTRKSANWETNRFFYSLNPSSMTEFIKRVEAA